MSLPSSILHAIFASWFNRDTKPSCRRKAVHGPWTPPCVEHLEARTLPVVTPLDLPLKSFQNFVVEDYNNKITQADLGVNYFGGNSGELNNPQPSATVNLITSTDLVPSGNGSNDFALQINYTFSQFEPLSDPPPKLFGGLFQSLLGLTATKLRLGEEIAEPALATDLAGSSLDFEDFFGPLDTLQDQVARSIDQVRLDLRLPVDSPNVKVRLELKDEAGVALIGYASVNSTSWQTFSILVPNAPLGDVSGLSLISLSPADPQAPAFNWHEVSQFSLIVERVNVGALVNNPVAGSVQFDNLRLVDVDGQYPDFSAMDDGSGALRPQFNTGILELVRNSGLQYFLDFASSDPLASQNGPSLTGGLVQDRSLFADLLTTGGAGFQLTAYVIAAQQGLLVPTDAANRTLELMQVLEQNQGSAAIGTTGFQGFFYHFLGPDGKRKINFDVTSTEFNESTNTVELSTIDTTLAISGILTAGEYFRSAGLGALGMQIHDLAQAMYARVNWSFMLQQTEDLREGHSGEMLQQLSLGWKPNEPGRDDTGPFGRFLLNDDDGTGQYSSKSVLLNNVPTEVHATLDYYTDEGILAALLGMAAPNPEFRLPRDVWDDQFRLRSDGFVKTFPGSLFTYQFGSVWLDTQTLGRDNHALEPLDFYENTQAAIQATQDYVSQNPQGWTTYAGPNGDQFWGLNATEGPFDAYLAYSAPQAALGAPTRTDTITLQAEGETVIIPDPPGLTFRENAQGKKTIHLNGGDSLTIPFTTTGAALSPVTIQLRYSNSNANDLPNETITVQIDGTTVGIPFVSADTGDGGGAWENFVLSEILGPTALPRGAHALVITLADGDGFGWELDAVTLTSTTDLTEGASVEDGTSTVYGVASSILHDPSSAIESLWTSIQVGLWHPRFGMADAFNFDVADARTFPNLSQDPQIRRDHGPWINFTGFAIDQGPLAILLDNALSNNAIPQLFSNETHIASVLSSLFGPTDIDLSAQSVSENSSVGLVVGALTGTDPDPTQSLTFTLLDSAGGRFALQGNQLIVANPALLDFETATSHTVVVRVTDPSNFSVDKQFRISITDDLPILVTSQGVTTSKRGRAVAIDPSLTITDADSTTFAHALLTVTITAGQQDGDRLTLLPNGKGPDKLKIAKGQLRLGRQVLGTVTGGQGETPFRIQFNNSISLALARRVARQVAFSGNAKARGLRGVQFELQEDTGLGTSIPVVKQIEIV